MDQIKEAVRCALDPSGDQSVKTQAMKYLEDVKTSPDGWQVCLQLFTNVAESSSEARLFALQVLEAMLQDARASGSDNDSSAKIDTVRQLLLQFISTQYSGSKYSAEVPFVKNKLAHTITLLALASYPAQWPTFIRDLISMAGLPVLSGQVTEDSAAGTNTSAVVPTLVDFYTKVLASLDEEMVNPTVPRGKEEVARNTAIKDAMRIEDVNLMANSWYTIIFCMSSTHPELVKGTLGLMGAYVSWIDINLIVNQPFMNILFALLKGSSLQSEACKCLTEIVSKGMRPMEKLYLLQFLNIIDVMKQLNTTTVDFAEQVAKLTNAVGVELKAIWIDKETATKDAQSTACTMMEQLMPLVLQFLSHEYDEVSSAVFPAINDILGLFKKIQRDGGTLAECQQRFLTQLLPVLIEKLKYDEDFPWPSPDESGSNDCDGSLDEDDDEVMFGELRRNLRVFIDAVGQIAPGLYDNVVLGTTQEIYKQCGQFGVSSDKASDEGENGQGKLGWVRAELGLYLTQSYGERLSSNKALRFGNTKAAGQIQTNGSSATNGTVGASIEALSELMNMMIQSGIIDCSHPAIASTYFENCMRFSGFFDVQREVITPVLTAFLGSVGVCHPYKTVRSRVWYLLYRFVKQIPASVLPMYSADFIPAVNGLLTINADPATLTKIAANPGSGYGLFDSQLYLFETCGMMLSPSGLDDNVRMTLLQRLFDPLFSGAQHVMNSQSAQQILDYPQLLLQIHHYLTAIGAIVKGFPDVRVDSKNTMPSSAHHLTPNTVQVFMKAADMCIAILDALKASQIIREAVRFTLSRLLSVLGSDALPYIPRLIDSLVSSCEVDELCDLLGFLGLVIFKFKPHVATTANEILLPVISKVYGFLDQVAQDGATGTDESVLLLELRKAYLTWLIGIFNADLDSVFLTPQNSQHLFTILRPVVTQLAMDNSSPQCQKLAFGIIHKIVLAWLIDPQGWHSLSTLTAAGIAAINNSAGTAVPANNQGAPMLRKSAAQTLGLDLNNDSIKKTRSEVRQFVMDSIVRVCFEVPTCAEFNPSDAQSSMVITDITTVLQSLLFAGMPEIVSDDGSAVSSIKSTQLLTLPVGGDLNQNHFAAYLSTALLPSLGCPTNMATEFVQALASLGQKQFKKYFINFIKR